MWLLWFVACTHEHDAMQERISKLEKIVESQKKEIHVIKSQLVHAKKTEGLCSKERENSYVLSRTKLTAFMKKEELPRVVPYQENGDILGLRLASVSDSWRSCGFEDSDVIVSIQGVQIRSARILSQVYSEHKNTEEIQIQRIRNKRESQIRIRILNVKK